MGKISSLKVDGMIFSGGIILIYHFLQHNQKVALQVKATLFYIFSGWFVSPQSNTFKTART
jgi:hypothetical protein